MARLAAAQLNGAGGAEGGAGSTRGGEPPRIVIYAFASDLGHARATDSGTDPGTSHGGHGSHHACGNGNGGGDDGGGNASGGSFGGPGPGPGAGRGSCGCPGGGRAGIPEFATGGMVDPGLLSRFSCDSVLQKALLSTGGALLDPGRDVRTVSPAQRRALVARDRGCVIPGCTAPAHWCEAHHVVYWRNNGPTDIGNLALVCSRHHSEIHSGIWALEMRDGVPWACPPGWIDPKQRLIRNTYTSDVQTIRGIGMQLRLPFDENPENPESPDDFDRSQSDHPGWENPGPDPPPANDTT